MAMASGWADLLDDTLDMIAQRTPGIKDYVRIRAVCKPWRSFLRPKSTPPWLVLPYDPCGQSCTRGFLDVSDGTVHELVLPETRGARWPDVWLLNPATREHVQVPPLTRRGEAWPCARFMERGARERWEDRAYRSLRRPVSDQPVVRAAALSSDPSLDGDCTVVNGRFHLVSHYGRVAVFDLVSPLREVPTRRDALLHALAHTWDGRCLVQRHGGELLMAVSAWSQGDRELVVFRLGSDGWWTEAGDAGGDVVLLASTDSGGQVFRTATCEGGKGTVFDSSKLMNLPWFSDDKREGHRVTLLSHGYWDVVKKITFRLSTPKLCRSAGHHLTSCLDHLLLLLDVSDSQCHSY
ncbi:hypothetical protein ACP70R_011094 [Stipagrostis hirtigluma subsp. patula]